MEDDTFEQIGSVHVLPTIPPMSVKFGVFNDAEDLPVIVLGMAEFDDGPEFYLNAHDAVNVASSLLEKTLDFNTSVRMAGDNCKECVEEAIEENDNAK